LSDDLAMLAGKVVTAKRFDFDGRYDAPTQYDIPSMYEDFEYDSLPILRVCWLCIKFRRISLASRTSPGTPSIWWTANSPNPARSLPSPARSRSCHRPTLATISLNREFLRVVDELRQL
jgi:hypothetical protein